MRQRDRHLAQGGCPADVRELRLRLTQRFFGAPPFGDVAGDLGPANDLAGGVLDRGDGERDVDLPGVLRDPDSFKVINALASPYSVDNQ
jgi:hypothetical protein